MKKFMPYLASAATALALSTSAFPAGMSLNLFNSAGKPLIISLDTNYYFHYCDLGENIPIPIGSFQVKHDWCGYKNTYIHDASSSGILSVTVKNASGVDLGIFRIRAAYGVEPFGGEVIKYPALYQEGLHNIDPKCFGSGYNSVCTVDIS
ncbi:MAG: hypothetical protein ACYCQI_00455 [Gammaproteobacteria bacterium]